jgi:hypothetical protein
MSSRHPTHYYRLTHDLTGQRFERLVVLEYHGSRKQQSIWHCLCDCGNHVYLATNRLTSGNTRSCGCLHRDIRKGSQYAKKHGLWKTPEWQAWSQMRRRCYSPKHISYKNYGARGITVCERWRDSDSFPAFFADMGPRPSPQHSLERLDNSQPYSPQNCRWVTMKEQARNRRNTHLITFNGETLCLKDWAKKLGIAYNSLLYRLKQGMPLERALSPTPLSRWDQ